ncbi:hypothetical protein RRG08_025762 [Elysia crispata]|uniref:Uncharacterized protein n=1 Tax=Elysia crispata TaxID=231223 RepID=A0AAE1DYZ6_9GAST|nr:hypothetical protein RRG08_025762 [Elysia crispata]
MSHGRVPANVFSVGGLYFASVHGNVGPVSSPPVPNDIIRPARASFALGRCHKSLALSSIIQKRPTGDSVVIYDS